jgi:hypothetical protein
MVRPYGGIRNPSFLTAVNSMLTAVLCFPLVHSQLNTYHFTFLNTLLSPICILSLSHLQALSQSRLVTISSLVHLHHDVLQLPPDTYFTRLDICPPLQWTECLLLTICVVTSSLLSTVKGYAPELARVPLPHLD